MANIPTKVTGDSLAATDWNLVAEFANRTFDQTQTVSTNLDSATDTGIYYFDNNTTNRPSTILGGTNGVVLTIENLAGVTAIVFQLALSQHNGAPVAAVRYRPGDNVWRPWTMYPSGRAPDLGATSLNDVKQDGIRVWAPANATNGPGFEAVIEVITDNEGTPKVIQRAFGVPGFARYASRSFSSGTWTGWSYASIQIGVPSTANAAGLPGNWAANSSYIYKYIGDGTSHSWVRTAAAAW
jgi:hypothetical protein